MERQAEAGATTLINHVKRAFLLLAFATSAATACDFVIDTLVGKSVPEDVLAVETPVAPTDVAWDGSMLFVATHGRVRTLDADGRLRTIAGVGEFPGALSDGIPALTAEFRSSALAVDDTGDVFASMLAHEAIRAIRDDTSLVETIVGVLGERATSWPPTEGSTASETPMVAIHDVALDGDGRVVFCTGSSVWRVEHSGALLRLAGSTPSGDFTGSGDGGAARDARFADLRSLAVDGFGWIIVSDALAHRIRRFEVGGIITTIAGMAGDWGYTGDGQPAELAKLNQPMALAVARDGAVVFVDRRNRVLRRVRADGIIETIAGNGESGTAVDGALALGSSFSGALAGVVETTPGRFVFGDAANGHLIALEPNGTLSIVGGNGTLSYGGDDGPAASGILGGALGLALLEDGSLLIADGVNGRIRIVTPDGMIETWAGNGTIGSDGDGGDALDASVQPFDIARGPDGTVYFTEPFLVRSIGTDGIVRRVAGTGERATNYVDGMPALETPLFGPEGIDVGDDGSIYVIDAHRLRVVGSDGVLRTIAGTGQSVSSGDGGLASEAGLADPRDVAVAMDGRVFIPETAGNRVRLISTDGVISTIAGTGVRDDTGDGGPAVDAALAMPRSITLSSSGDVYVTSWTGKVRRIDTDGIIETIAGTGDTEFNGDEICARDATIERPAGIVVRGDEILVADEFARRVRIITPDDRVSIDDPDDRHVPLSTSIEFRVIPNPSRGLVRFVLATDRSGPVDIDLFDVRGRHVARVWRVEASVGVVEFDWAFDSGSVREIGPGVYLAVAKQAGRRLATKKLILTR